MTKNFTGSCDCERNLLGSNHHHDPYSLVRSA